VKRRSDNDVQNKNNEKYETYRKQLFLSSWATDRPWLPIGKNNRNSEWFFIII
jgi:hypothetical protein